MDVCARDLYTSIYIRGGILCHYVRIGSHLEKLVTARQGKRINNLLGDISRVVPDIPLKHRDNAHLFSSPYNLCQYNHQVDISLAMNNKLRIHVFIFR